ncbi:hypothetical protein Ddye_029425 [Dipteronia dyeriana]|uniref:UDP-glycosyltransferase n=1 Tax=Dipteronia dyeriana TaxID=168575 RepID=A0AAD9TF38_9ROSI|nr:hypothetical protein Ddye_029425 [Dipteronia dyeriana]
MGRQPHVLVIPYPAQGHVMPLMKLSMKIAEHGVKVTFVITEFIEAKIMASMPEKAWWSQIIRFVSIPDGLEGEDDRKDAAKTRETMLRVMPGHLKNLIDKVNQSNDGGQIKCVLADTTVGWVLEVAKKMGIPGTAVTPAGPGGVALSLHIPKLIEAGIIDTNGTPMSDELISLSKETPAWKVNELTWSSPSDPKIQKIIFEYVSSAVQTLRNSNWVLCNYFNELDPWACDLVPNMLTIGPLLASNHSGHLAGNFWPEDSTCLSWLDKQPTGSVIYVSFGSLAKLNQQQLHELALGLESLDQPFLWVVRKDLVQVSNADHEFPEGFTERVASRGKVVEWAPQEKVLAHPSVACFLSHCGWNSTIEGLSMGVPFLCWPYFADQFHNRSYICDAWKVGLELIPDNNGIITSHELETKIKTLLIHDAIKANALKLKEMARKSLAPGGSSFQNFQSFIAQIFKY